MRSAPSSAPSVIDHNHIKTRGWLRSRVVPVQVLLFPLLSDKRQISIPNLFFSIDSAARSRAGSDLRVRSVKLFHLQWRGFFVHVFRFLSVDGGTRALAEGRRIIAAVIMVVWCSILLWGSTVSAIRRSFPNTYRIPHVSVSADSLALLARYESEKAGPHDSLLLKPHGVEKWIASHDRTYGSRKYAVDVTRL